MGYNSKELKVKSTAKKLAEPKDAIVSQDGQYKYAGQITKILGNQFGTPITMEGISYPLRGKDNLGNTQMMYPGAEYFFPGSSVTEYPMKRQLGGPTPPEDWGAFLAYNITAPENRQAREDWTYGDPNQYDHYGMWDALGKPSNFEEALKNNPDWTLNEYDDSYHGFSVNPNTGVWLKDYQAGEGVAPGSTAWMEANQHYLNPESYNNFDLVYDPELQRMRYVPKQRKGGFIPIAQKGKQKESGTENKKQWARWREEQGIPVKVDTPEGVKTLNTNDPEYRGYYNQDQLYRQVEGDVFEAPNMLPEATVTGVDPRSIDPMTGERYPMWDQLSESDKRLINDPSVLGIGQRNRARGVTTNELLQDVGNQLISSGAEATGIPSAYRFFTGQADYTDPMTYLDLLPGLGVANKTIKNVQKLRNLKKAVNRTPIPAAIFDPKTDWGKEYFEKINAYDKELQSKKLSRNDYLKRLNNYDEHLKKKLGLLEELGRGLYGSVHTVAGDASKVIKLGNPMGGGWTPELIESLKSIKQNANLAIPEQVQNFEIPSVWRNTNPSIKEALIMPNLNITKAEKLNLNKRDRYALFLKQARQLRDKGIGLDIANYQNFKFNEDKNVFDLYDLNPNPDVNSSFNPGYYMSYIRDNTKRRMLDNMMYKYGGNIYQNGGVKYGSKEYNKAYREGTIVTKGYDGIFQGKDLPEATVTSTATNAVLTPEELAYVLETSPSVDRNSFRPAYGEEDIDPGIGYGTPQWQRSGSQRYPNWDSLTKEEKRLITDSGPIGRSIRSKAGFGKDYYKKNEDESLLGAASGLGRFIYETSPLSAAQRILENPKGTLDALDQTFYDVVASPYAAYDYYLGSGQGFSGVNPLTGKNYGEGLAGSSDILDILPFVGQVGKVAKPLSKFLTKQNTLGRSIFPSLSEGNSNWLNKFLEVKNLKSLPNSPNTPVKVLADSFSNVEPATDIEPVLKEGRLRDESFVDDATGKSGIKSDASEQMLSSNLPLKDRVENMSKINLENRDIVTDVGTYLKNKKDLSKSGKFTFPTQQQVEEILKNNPDIDIKDLYLRDSPNVVFGEDKETAALNRIKEQNKIFDEGTQFNKDWIFTDSKRADELTKDLDKTINERVEYGKKYDVARINNNFEDISFDKIKELLAKEEQIQKELLSITRPEFARRLKNVKSLETPYPKEPEYGVLSINLGPPKPEINRPIWAKNSSTWNAKLNQDIIQGNKSTFSQNDPLLIRFSDSDNTNLNKLSKSDRNYLAKDAPNIGGVKTKGSTITLGEYVSRPSISLFEPKPIKKILPGRQFYDIIKSPLNFMKGVHEEMIPGGKPVLYKETKLKLKDPIAVAGTGVHEGAHDIQSNYNFSHILGKYDSKYKYYTNEGTPFGEKFGKYLIDPVEVKPNEEDHYDTWLSSGNELHSETQKARFKLYKQLVDNGLDSKIAMKQLQEPTDGVLDMLIEDFDLDKHFKKDAPKEVKREIIKNYMPAIVTAAGTAATLGALQEEKYGGGFKDLNFNEEDYMKKGGSKKLKINSKFTNKNIQSSINELFKRNETLFGPKGKKYYKPFAEGGSTNNTNMKKLTDKEIAFPQQPTAAEFYARGFVPNSPVGFYRQGGMSPAEAYPQQPPADMFFSGYPFQPQYMRGGMTNGIAFPQQPTAEYFFSGFPWESKYETGGTSSSAPQDMNSIDAQIGNKKNNLLKFLQSNAMKAIAKEEAQKVKQQMMPRIKNYFNEGGYFDQAKPVYEKDPYIQKKMNVYQTMADDSMAGLKSGIPELGLQFAEPLGNVIAGLKDAKAKRLAPYTASDQYMGTGPNVSTETPYEGTEVEVNPSAGNFDWNSPGGFAYGGYPSYAPGGEWTWADEWEQKDKAAKLRSAIREKQGAQWQALPADMSYEDLVALAAKEGIIKMSDVNQGTQAGNLYPIPRRGFGFTPYGDYRYKIRGRSSAPIFSDMNQGTGYPNMSNLTPEQQAAMKKEYADMGFDLEYSEKKGLLRDALGLGPRVKKLKITKRPGTSISNKSESNLNKDTKSVDVGPPYRVNPNAQNTYNDFANIGSKPVDRNTFFQDRINQDIQRMESNPYFPEARPESMIPYAEQLPEEKYGGGFNNQGLKKFFPGGVNRADKLVVTERGPGIFNPYATEAIMQGVTGVLNNAQQRKASQAMLAGLQGADATFVKDQQGRMGNWDINAGYFDPKNTGAKTTGVQSFMDANINPGIQQSKYGGQGQDAEYIYMTEEDIDNFMAMGGTLEIFE